MLRYVSKFFLEILPSVVATVVGAYIVNHYISPKSPAEAPKAASIVHVDPSPVDSSQPSKNASGGVTPSASSGHDSTSRDARTKSVDKAFAKVQTDKASDTTKDAAKDLPKESIKDLAKTEPDIRHFIARDKEKSAPSETASIAPAIPDEHPDAAELARAALERLRATEPARPGEVSATPPPSATHEASHEPPRDAPHLDAPHLSVVTVAPPQDVRPAVPPLPPPVSVVTPIERASLGTGTPPDAPEPQTRYSQSDRPVPPADIPISSDPVDLQAAAAPAKKKSVTDEMMSAARSVFQHVVPQ